MEYLFQADINGSLERLERIESGHGDLGNRSSTDLILESLKATLKITTFERQIALNQAKDHQSVQDSACACHTVLFDAWLRKTDALTCFSVSRYPRGVLSSEYYQIIEALSLTNFFKHSMYSLHPEVAGNAFKELLPYIETSRLYDYLPTYLRVCNGIESDGAYNSSIDHLYSTLTNTTLDTQLVQQLLTTMMDFYLSDIQLSSHHILGYSRLLLLLHDTSRDIIGGKLSHTWKRLTGVVHGKYKDVISDTDMKKLMGPLFELQTRRSVEIKVADRMLSSTDSIMSDRWNECLSTPTTAHERHHYAFKLICATIWKNAVPSRGIDTRRNHIGTQDVQAKAARKTFIERWTSACGILINHLSSITQEKNKDIDHTLVILMERCLESLMELHGSWRSIIKAMTQFSDLWISILETKESIAAFSDLIVMAETWTHLYQFAINTINFQSEDGETELVTQQQKAALSTLVHLVIEQMETDDLLQLIYDTYAKRSLPTDQDTSMPMMLDLFDDMATLKKICNQFVQTQQDDNRLHTATNDKDQVEPRILNQLAKLSTLSPYVTLLRLVNQVLENKGQHGLVVSILQHLGDLCMLRRYPDDKTLFGHIIDALLLSMKHQYKGLEMLAPMLFGCWKEARDPHAVILLDSYANFTSKTTFTPIIIHPKELLDYCLLPALKQHSIDQPLVSNILGLINVLTEDVSMMANKWQQLLKPLIHIPILLEMNFDILMETITIMMDERYNDASDWEPHRLGTDGLNIFGLSTAMDLGRKLMMAIEHVYQVYQYTTTPERIDDVKMKLCSFHDGLDSSDWRTRLFWEGTYQYVDKSDKYTPDGDGERLIWLPHAHMSLNMANDQDWNLILNGCRSSPLFTDMLFKRINASEERVGPIWNHPHESTTLRELLIRNLHSSCFVAVHYEYKLLLDYFLGLLYDAHGNNNVIRSYRYGNDNVMAHVKLLTDEHYRLFFKALHALLLLDLPETIKSSSNDVAGGELHYVSGIVQTIQNMANWKRLGKEDAVNPTSLLTRRQISVMADHPKNIIDPATPAESSHQREMAEISTEGPSTDTSLILNPEDTSITSSLLPLNGTKPTEVVNCLYPWLDENRESGRALCLLIIHYICLVSKSIQSQKSYEVIRVLLLQMVEGLEDRQERDKFMEHYHNKQTKAAINRWKKNKKDRRIRVHLRPLISDYEMELIKDSYRNLSSAEDQMVLLTLVNPQLTSTAPILYTYYTSS